MLYGNLKDAGIKLLVLSVVVIGVLVTAYLLS